MNRIQNILDHYDYSKLTIGVLGSHSALDVCRGAKDERFSTLVIAQKGRQKTYQKYYKTGIHKNHAKDDVFLGCVDECIIVDQFYELLSKKVQQILKQKNAIFIPHRSFEAYLNFDYQAIENDFNVPIFGNRYLLKIEERGTKPNQYDLLKKAGIRYPQQFKNPKDIDRLCIVKVLEKERGFERAFFIINSYSDYKRYVQKKIKLGVFTQEQLDEVVIEEFILGVQVNFNFFYSPIQQRLELLGTDTRRQTNVEGFTKLPVWYQDRVLEMVPLKYEEAGHVAVTVVESMLEQAFALGEQFVKATQKVYPPGIIGPFALQAVIVPGPPKKDIVVIDVSPRIPGSPGISATPYSNYLFGQPISVGRRIAMEIKDALKLKKLKNIIT